MDITGYGCDLQTLEKVYQGLEKVKQKFLENEFGTPKIYTAFKAEYEAIEEFTSERDQFISEAESIKENAINLDTWLGKEPPQGLEYFGMTKESERGHNMRVSCNKEDGERGAPPPKFPEDEEDQDPVTEYWPPKWPEGAIRWGTYGKFSIDKNEPRLLREYELLRDAWGERREQWYELPKEYSIMYFLQEYAQRYFTIWAKHQEQLTSTIIPKGTDPPLQVIEKFKPIRAAVSLLSRYGASLSQGEEEAGIRDFVRGLAYYLRRSCRIRPCNERLERVLKIVFKDACFPYTDGGISVKDPWDKCKKAAKLEY